MGRAAKQRRKRSDWDRSPVSNFHPEGLYMRARQALGETFRKIGEVRGTDLEAAYAEAGFTRQKEHKGGNVQFMHPAAVAHVPAGKLNNPRPLTDPELQRLLRSIRPLDKRG